MSWNHSRIALQTDMCTTNKNMYILWRKMMCGEIFPLPIFLNCVALFGTHFSLYCMCCALQYYYPFALYFSFTGIVLTYWRRVGLCWLSIPDPNAYHLPDLCLARLFVLRIFKHAYVTLLFLALHCTVRPANLRQSILSKYSINK